MRKVLVSLGQALGMTVMVSSGAEENKPAATTPRPEAAQMVDRRMVVIEKILKLTPEQAGKIREIMLNDQERFLQLRDDKSLTPDERNQRAGKILMVSAAEIQALLTPEQKEIWKAEAAKQR